MLTLLNYMGSGARVALYIFAGSGGPRTVFEYSSNVNDMKLNVISNMPLLGGDSQPASAGNENTCVSYLYKLHD